MSLPVRHFTGEGGGEREGAQRIARRLAPQHRDVGFALLFSAAAYLIRAGQSPSDSRVVEEAKMRRRRQAAAVRRFRARHRMAEAA